MKCEKLNLTGLLTTLSTSSLKELRINTLYYLYPARAVYSDTDIGGYDNATNELISLLRAVSRELESR